MFRRSRTGFARRNLIKGMPKKLNKTIIGLDVGGNSLKMVKGVKDNGTIRVLDFANLTYSAQDGISSVISSDVPRLLNSLLDTKKDKKTDMHATISGRNLCIRVVSLPILPGSKSLVNRVITSLLTSIWIPNISLGQ